MQKTITLEEHFITKDFVKATDVYGGMPEGGAAPQGPFGHLQAQLLDLGAGRVAAMDEAGIDLQVISAAALGFDELGAAEATALAGSMNDELAAAIAARPDRLNGFALLGMKEPARAARELERCVRDLHLVGPMIDGTCDGEFLDAERFLPVLEAAAHLRVPVYLHPAPPPATVQKAYFSGLPREVAHLLSIAGWGWHAETALHTLRLVCAGVFDRLPDLQVIIGHMGEMLPFALARSSAALSGAAKLQRPVAEYFQTNLSITTSGYFTLPPFQCAREVVGLERMMFSVDYPFSANTKGREFLDKAATVLDEREMAMLTHENAQRVLGL